MSGNDCVTGSICVCSSEQSLGAVGMETETVA